jgi:hypothetical protein
MRSGAITRKSGEAIMGVRVASPRKVFGPDDLAKLTRAYDAALSTVVEDEDFRKALTARELRDQLAAVIMARAKGGQLNPERLRDDAIESLSTPFDLDQLHR